MKRTTSQARFRMVALVSLIWVSCMAAVPGLGADPKKAKITYDEHVLPILKDKCGACHNPDKTRGGLNVSNYTALMAGGSSGEVLKAGDAEGSRLFQLVSHKQQPFMPPKSPMMESASIETLRKWIDGGLLENSGSKSKVVNRPKYEMALTSISKGKPEGPPAMPSAKVNLEPFVRAARPGALTALAASPWAPLFAVAGQKQVLLYHSDSLELLGVLPFPEGSIHVLRFSRNGSLLLAGGGRGGKSGRVVVWNVTTGERIFEVGDESDIVLAADISADQTQIALGGPSKVVRVFSTKDGQVLREIRKHTDWIYAVEYSPDGVLLATADRGSGLFVWEAFTGREYFMLRGHGAAVTSLSWRADGNVLASASEDTTIRLWEMENGGNIKGWGAHGGGVLSVQFARDGRLISCGRDQAVRMWDQNGAQQRVFDSFPDVALRTAFSHDAARAAGGDWSGIIRVWTTADGKLAGTLNGNPPSISEQLELATKELTQRELAQGQLVLTAAASQKAAEKAAAELAAAQKAASEVTSAARAATDELGRARDLAEKAKALAAAAQSHVSARDILVRALSEAAAKVKEAAGKDPKNKELAGAATRAADLAALENAELAKALKALTEAQAAAKVSADQLAATQQKLSAISASAANAPKVVEQRAAEVKVLLAKATNDRVVMDAQAAQLASLRQRVDRLRQAVVSARPATR